MIRPQIKPQRIRSENRLAWCRRQPCIGIGRFDEIDGKLVLHECRGSVEASHVRPIGHGGVGTKPGDDQTLPKCGLLHRIFHDLGRESFEYRYGMNLDRKIAEHNARYRKEHPAKPKKERRVSPKASLTVRNCVCNGDHQFPLSKVQFGETGISYLCPIRREGVILSLKK